MTGPIIERTKVVAAVDRALRLDPDYDAAVAAVAATLHLSEDTVRECVDLAEREEPAC